MPFGIFFAFLGLKIINPHIYNRLVEIDNLAQLFREVNLEIFRNQIYLVFFPK
jgi:hypothetical protein